MEIDRYENVEVLHRKIIIVDVFEVEVEVGNVRRLRAAKRVADVDEEVRVLLVDVGVGVVIARHLPDVPFRMKATLWRVL